MPHPSALEHGGSTSRLQNPWRIFSCSDEHAHDLILYFLAGTLWSEPPPSAPAVASASDYVHFSVVTRLLLQHNKNRLSHSITARAFSSAISHSRTRASTSFMVLSISGCTGNRASHWGEISSAGSAALAGPHKIVDPMKALAVSRPDICWF